MNFKVSTGSGDAGPSHWCSVCGREFSGNGLRKGSRRIGPCCAELSEKKRVERRRGVLEAEWVGTESGLPFLSLAPYSHTTAEWKCTTCGHTWAATLTNRMSGTRCPACTGKVVTPTNCLAAVRPDLASLWDQEKNGDVTPWDVTPSSHRRAHFRCGHGHSYPRAVYAFAARGGCKYCTQVATPERNLTLSHPELAAEWHPARNESAKPEEYLPGSNKLVWWKCRFGHSWKASIDKRALRHDGCPKCWTKASLIQIRVFSEIKSIFPDVQFEPFVEGHEVDVWVPSLGLGVEIDGYRWHLSRVAQDTLKSDILSKAGYRLLRLREKGLPALEDPTVVFKTRVGKEAVDDLLRKVIATLPGLHPETVSKIEAYLSSDDFAGNATYQEICANRNFSVLGASLAERYPAVAAEWCFAKNGPLTPKNVRPSSNQKVWFTCPDCGKEYRARIDHRTVMKSGCPYESGKKVAPEASLAALHPALMKELHPTKNGRLDPFTVAPKSNVPLYWLCPQGHAFPAPPNRRVSAFEKRGRYSQCWCSRSRATGRSSL